MADTEALKDCLFATEIQQKMATISVRSAKEEEREWKERVRIRTDTKKIMFNFGKTVSHNIALKMAKARISYTRLEELFLKNASQQAFQNGMKEIFNCSNQTKVRKGQ